MCCWYPVIFSKVTNSCCCQRLLKSWPIKLKWHGIIDASGANISLSATLFFIADLEQLPTIVLGELCRQIQIMLYKQVLPKVYDPRKSYKIKHIQEDVKDLKDDEQQEAKRRFDDLKKKLKWQEKIHIRAMKSIQESRNVAAHPELNEELIRFAVDHMEMNGKLTDWHSPDCVRAFIEMWKTLSQLWDLLLTVDVWTNQGCTSGVVCLVSRIVVSLSVINACCLRERYFAISAFLTSHKLRDNS